MLWFSGCHYWLLVDNDDSRQRATTTTNLNIVRLKVCPKPIPECYCRMPFVWLHAQTDSHNSLLWSLVTTSFSEYEVIMFSQKAFKMKQKI